MSSRCRWAAVSAWSDTRGLLAFRACPPHRSPVGHIQLPIEYSTGFHKFSVNIDADSEVTDNNSVVDGKDSRRNPSIKTDRTIPAQPTKNLGAPSMPISSPSSRLMPVGSKNQANPAL
jgi:hypothetical protein